MTVILTVGNKRGIYQSSDFQLTEDGTGKFISDEPGSKQLDSEYLALYVKLSLTGVASIGGRKTIYWLADEMKKLEQITNINVICEALVQWGNTKLGSGRNKHGLLLVLAVGEVDRPFRVAEIANVDPETWALEKNLKGRFVRPINPSIWFEGLVPILSLTTRKEGSTRCRSTRPNRRNKSWTS